MKVLLVGNGGREHALAWRLARSASISRIICPNGNPGIGRHADTPQLSLDSAVAWAAYAKHRAVDLVVIGPEAPLAEGLADECRGLGIATFGPGKDGAQLEASKSWAKSFLNEIGVPTAKGDVFVDPALAAAYAAKLGFPCVIKADGLAAGKGVAIVNSQQEADDFIDQNLNRHRFGEASTRVVIEECLEGEELSILALCDGHTVLPLVPARDHKRAFDGDEGPNTGGMGAFAPAEIGEEFFTAAFGEILRPTLDGLRARGIDFRGVLYAGLMLTKDGPKVLEYNCRFGDPETQAVLPLIDGDFGALLLACAEGRLGEFNSGAHGHSPSPSGITTRPDHCITVVITSGGYPGEYSTGYRIKGLDGRQLGANEMVFHSGTAIDEEGRLVSAGGRVLCCTAWDRTLAVARRRAYDLASSIHFDGCRYRSDIAAGSIPSQG